jgi:hypothetical protein
MHWIIIHDPNGEPGYRWVVEHPDHGEFYFHTRREARAFLQQQRV